jgi:hypothetical protein
LPRHDGWSRAFARFGESWGVDVFQELGMNFLDVLALEAAR